MMDNTGSLNSGIPQILIFSISIFPETASAFRRQHCVMLNCFCFDYDEL